MHDRTRPERRDCSRQGVRDPESVCETPGIRGAPELPRPLSFPPDLPDSGGGDLGREPVARVGYDDPVTVDERKRAWRRGDRGIRRIPNEHVRWLLLRCDCQEE